ncbi:MAG: hypothetical protein AAB388_04280 [Patescibacteria group bacterium]
MKNKIFIGGALSVMVIVAFVLVSKSNPHSAGSPITYTEDGDISVVSSDGQATLILPPTALPEGVQPTDLAIIPVSASEVFGTDGDAAEGLAYKLLPDGATFSEPVVVSITSGITGDVLPTVLHTSGESVSFLTPQLVIIDPAQNTQTLAFEVSHFSKVGVDANRGLFHYRFTGGGSAKVGETLPYKIEVWPDSYNHFYDTKGGYKWTRDTYSGEGFYYRFAPGGWYDIKDWSLNDWRGILTPQKVDVTGRRNLKENDVYTYEMTLTCAAPGTTNPVTSNIGVAYRSARSSSGRDWEYQTDWTYLFVYPSDFTCTSEGDELPVIEYLSGAESASTRSMIGLTKYGDVTLPNWRFFEDGYEDTGEGMTVIDPPPLIINTPTVR